MFQSHVHTSQSPIGCRHYLDGSQPPMFMRSVFGLVYSFNLLPQTVVDSLSVSAFQSKLQAGFKQAQRQGVDFWPTLLRDGPHRFSVDRFQAFFN